MIYLIVRLYQTMDFSCQKSLALLFSTDMKNLFIVLFLFLASPIMAIEAPWIAEDGPCEAVDIKNLGYNVNIILCMTILERKYVAFVVKQNEDCSPLAWIQADWDTTRYFFPWVLERDYKYITQE